MDKIVLNALGGRPFCIDYYMVKKGSFFCPCICKAAFCCKKMITLVLTNSFVAAFAQPMSGKAIILSRWNSFTVLLAEIETMFKDRQVPYLMPGSPLIWLVLLKCQCA